MTPRGRLGSLAPPLLLLSIVLSALVAGTARPPSVAAAAAQLLPPGARCEELSLAGGGFVRAREILLDDTGEGVSVRTANGWREIPTVQPAGEVTTRRLWLGTDQQGRDVLARALRGAPLSLSVALLATLVALTLGTAVGMWMALSGGATQRLLHVATDALLGLPRLLLLLMLGLVLRGSPGAVGLAIGLAAWPESARLVEAETRALRHRPFSAAAHAAGAGRLRLAWRHLLPNVVPLLAVAAPLVATEAILLESTLAFLGVPGGSPASWGRMVAEAQLLLPRGWSLALFPGLLLCLTAGSVHALSRAVRPSRPIHVSTTPATRNAP
ncbi:MAG: ABC transporter permease [bacterium]|nr:ABC transporter permease [bacterium]